MKKIFSRKHDTQTGNSKYKFWFSGPTQERSAPRQVPIQTDNTRDSRTSSRVPSATNLQPIAVEDKHTVSISTPGPSVEKSIFPATRTHTVPQANFLPPRPSSSRHRDYNETPRAVHPPISHEREDRAKGFRRVPSGNELAPKHRTELWPPPQSSKQPGPLDDRYREQEDTERRRYRNEGKPDARYVRTEASKAKESREGDEDRFKVTREQFREDYGTTRDRHASSQRPREKDRARESEPEVIRERERDRLRQRERESHQREYEKERQKAEKQREERERVRQQETENERERERLNEFEKELEKERLRERVRELDRERQREEELQRQREEWGRERERQRQKEERQREKQREEREKERDRRKEMELERQREFEKGMERQREVEREKLREERERERERERLMELEKERGRERQRELEKERQKELERETQKEFEKEGERLREERERELEKEREKQRELEQQRLREEMEQEIEKERENQRELERQKLKGEREREIEKERDRQLERQKLKEEREREVEKEREKQLERQRLKEEREREVEKERERQLERQRLKEEREREVEKEREKQLERQRLKEEREREVEKERERQLERQRLKDEREREVEKERERQLERQRLKEEREREVEKEREKQLERQRLREERERELERERQRELERQREREVDRERQRELERQREREVEKERERQRELERQRLKDEREWEFEKERERQLQRQKLKEERERDVEREREERQRLKEEREREVEKEKQRELERQREREVDRERQRELERQREKEVEKERERQRELQRQRLKDEREREFEKERERQLQRQKLKEEREREVEKERERQLERQRLKEEREREVEREREERQRLKEEREKEVDKERQRELERQRLKEEREREVEKERERQLERQRQKEEREMEVEREREERQRLKEEKEKEVDKERQRELERQKLKDEREREVERERERQLERQRLREERERELERERQRELERQRLKEEKERERQMQKEKERLMEVDRGRERQRELENEWEKERQRQKDLERQRLMEERERERLEELERERQKEFEKERERQKDLELERQRQKEREREREKLMELERERERESQKEERERERQKEIEREREREHEKQKELQHLKDLERERLKEHEQERQKELEQQRERERRGKDRGKRGMARNRARQDQEEHDRDGLRHEKEKQMAKQSIVDLKPRDFDYIVDPSHRDTERVEGIVKGLKTVEVKPVGGETRKEKVVRDPHQGQEHYRQVKVRAETIDGNQDRLRAKTGWDRERRKLGRPSDDQQGLGLRTFKQPRHERPPVADGWGDSSDDSVDQMPVPRGSKHDRTDTEKVPLSRQDNILAPGNEFQLNQPPINALPPYSTPRAAPIPLTSIDTPTGRHALPLGTNLINFGKPHDNEPARREINWSKLDQDDTEPLKATESRPPSLVQTINHVQILPSQTQTQLDVQPSLHVKVHSEVLRAQDVPNELPVNAVLNSSLNTTSKEARHTQFRPVDGKVLKTLLNPPLELPKEAQVSSIRPMDAYKGKRTTVDAATTPSINLRLPTEAHPTPMQPEEKVRRTSLFQVQNTPPSVLMDVEGHQDPLVGNTRPLTTTDVPKRTWVSSVTPVPNLAISALPANSATVSSTTRSVDPHAQVLASLSPPGTQDHPVNFQSTRDYINNSTTTQTPAPQVRPPSSYGNRPTVPTAPSSEKPNIFRPTSAIPSPRHREAASLPPPSETFAGPFSPPLVNAPPHIRVPQSNASLPMSSFAVPPTPNWDRSLAARQEIRGSKADSPLLTKRDENVAEKHNFVPIPPESMVAHAEQIMEQPPTGGELNKVDPHLPLDVPGDHPPPSFAEARVVHRKIYHSVEPSRLDNTTWADPHNPSRDVGLVSQNATTRAGPEVLEKTAERPSTNHGSGGPYVLTGTGLTSSTQGPFATPVVDTQNQIRDSTEPGRTVYVGRDKSSKPTPDPPPRHVGKTVVSSNNQEASDKEQVDLLIGRPHMTSGFRRNDSNNHHKPLESQSLDQTNIAPLQGEGSSVRPPTRIIWKKGPNEAISEERTRQDARYQNQAVTSNMRLSMVSGPKMDHNRAPGPLHTPLIGPPSLGSEPLLADPNGMPARPIDRSPKRSLLPQTAEIRMSSSNVPSPGTRPKEVPLVTEASNKKFDAVPFLTPGPLPINVECPGKHPNHSPSAHTHIAEYAVPFPETIPPHFEIRDICHAPPIPRAAVVTTTLESSLTPVEMTPQIKIRHPIGVDDIKQGMELPLSSRTPILSGAPETAAVTSIPTMPPTVEVSPKASFGKGPVGVSNSKSQSRNQLNESPVTKFLKVEDVPSSFATSSKVRSDDFDGQAKKRSSNRESPRIKKVDPTLRVLLRDTDEPGKRKPSSKKVAAIIGDERVSRQDVHGVVPVVSSRQDNTEQLRSSKLSTQQLPDIGYQAEPNSDVLQTKIQHPVLAELLSSPQMAPMAQLTTPVQASDNGYPKERNTVHLGTTTLSIQSKLHGTPPERHRQDLEQKMKEATPISRPSHKKSSSMDIPPLREHHQLRTAVDVSRVKLARTSDQVDNDQRNNTNSNPHAPHGSRMSQEPNPNHRPPDSQRGTTMAPRLVQQPLQHAQGRHQHSVSLPTSSAILENPVQELPGFTPSDYANKGIAQGRPDMGHTPSDKHILSGSQETILMTPASFAPSLSLKQTDSRQSNAESARNGKRIRRFKLSSTQATPAESHQVWHPGTPSKTPNSSPSSGVGTPLQHNLNLKDPRKTQSVPFPVPKGEAIVAPFNYVSHRMKRSVSGASMEARNGNAPSTTVGSPNVSMRSSTPLPPPPTRDTWKATKDWVSKGEDRAQSRPKRKRPRPGVVFDTDEDVPEDKQRPRRTLTKHRSAAKRHETSDP